MPGDSGSGFSQSLILQIYIFFHLIGCLCSLGHSLRYANRYANLGVSRLSQNSMKIVL